VFDASSSCALIYALVEHGKLAFWLLGYEC
jgi:hypothetical protein